jgi:predicted dehydrogenase
MNGQDSSGQAGRRAGIGRRTLLAGAAAAGITIVKPSLVRGTQANSTIELGLIGCGGRGNWIMQYFQKHGQYKFVACADYYQDKVDATGEKNAIPADRRYTTLSAYKKMLEGKLDAVVIESPPYFHPEHAAAAIEAGKHVYLAKPIAVDVPGCQSIRESGLKATAGKQVFLVDFQTRANKDYREAARRVHAGKIGRLICGDAHYPCGHISIEAPASPEDRLRRWYCNKAISGDFIVEQSIHALDVASWLINREPVRAYGRGLSKGLRTYGDVKDHFNLVFDYPDDFVLSFYSVQMVHGAPAEIACRVYGEEGTIHTDYYGKVWMHTKEKKRDMEADVPDLYANGTIVNIAEFYEALTQGRYENATVPQSVRSNLTAILGRDAGYRNGAPLTWDEMMRKAEKLEPDLRGLKA